MCPRRRNGQWHIEYWSGDCGVETGILAFSVKENATGDLAKAPVSANQEGQRDPRA